MRRLGDAVPRSSPRADPSKLDRFLHDARRSGRRSMQQFARTLTRDVEALRPAIAGTVSGFTISNGLRQSLNHRLARIQKHRSVSLRQGRGCRGCSTTNCRRRQRFSAISSALGLKVAAMGNASSRNTCARAAIIPARAPRRRLVNAKPPDQLRISTSALQLAQLRRAMTDHIDALFVSAEVEALLLVDVLADEDRVSRRPRSCARRVHGRKMPSAHEWRLIGEVFALPPFM
jgi:hypothetical protein